MRPAPFVPPFRSTHGERLAAIALAVSVAGTAFVLVHRPDGRTQITVLDVGQGDAILVEGPRGGRMLVDGGPDPSRLLVALDERIAPWDRRIDALVLTHPHEDHVAGLAVLLDRYRIGRVFEPGMRGPGPGYAAFADRLAARGTSAGLLATGDRFALDEIRFDVLWPDPATVPREPSDTGTGINNVSVVLLGTIDGRRFLLAGDIEEAIDPILIGRGLPHVDVLKVAHHGSRTSSTTAFLDAVTPSVAVISAGAGNPYGHPAKATVERLQEHVAHVLRTDTNGSVEIDVSADRVTFHASGPRRVAARAVAVAGGGTQPAFLCGIPTRAVAAAPATTSRIRQRGPDRALGYHRPDDGPRAGRGRGPVAVARSARLARAAFPGSRRGRVLARRPHRSVRDGAESPTRRVGRAPP
jgi:competence protein ComEC